MAANGLVISFKYANLLIWAAHAAMVFGLVFVNPNHYTTIDSGYYLQSAQNILEGNGYTFFDDGHLKWNSVFPMGYSAAIAFVSWITGLPVLWTSKLVNILSSALLIRLFCRWYGAEKAIFFSSVLLTGPFLKLWAHTWSEPLFLVGLCVWARLFVSANNVLYKLVWSGLALILVRYAGIFILVPAIATGFFYMAKKDLSIARKFWVPVLFWILGSGVYMALNFYQGGEMYGGPRFQENGDAKEVVLMFVKGLLNELLLLRDLFPVRDFTLFFAGLAIQLFLYWQIWQIVKDRLAPVRPSRETIIYTGVAVAYLLFLFSLRLFSPFDPPGYRLLSPFTFLMIQGVMIHISEIVTFRELRWHVLAFCVCSWLDLIPRDGFLQKFL